MSYIKAPYNFVPINKTVVFPEWGAQVSHDIPFEDGVSGEITISITAHSSIFVRDELKGKDDKVGQFTQFEGKYFLPGTSLKGMFRNVLEIMSFCKMEKVNPHRYSIRDLAPSAKAIYMDNFKAKEIHCGWLEKDSNNNYTITDCGKPGRISHKELDKTFGSKLEETFSEKNKRSFNGKGGDEFKAAKNKYQLFKSHSRNHRFVNIGNSAGRELFGVDNSSKKEGTIIFTGQPGPRKRARNGRMTGHHLEFIFFKNQESPKYQVAEEVMENFHFAYYEHNKEQWSVDWKHWRKFLENGKRVPVFFRIEGGEVADFGLSYLYKLPYKNAINEAIAKIQKEEGIDLSQAIFGYTNEKEGAIAEDSLKGRVHIGHAFAVEGTAEKAAQADVILSSPKASYYPNYIRQNIRNGKVQGRYKTLMDAQPEIAGWKRYPVHSKGVTTNLDSNHKKAYEAVSTSFVPLKKGVRFNGTIRFHNLKKVELGALLSALTFHQTPNTFHSIGMAKPLGYGKIKVEVQNLAAKNVIPQKDDSFVEVGQVECLKAYEAYMNAALNSTTFQWHQSPQIIDLLTMVSEQPEAEDNLAYMDLGRNNQGKNEFVRAKNDFEALDRYSKLPNVQQVSIQSMVDANDIQQMQKQIEKNKDRYSQHKDLNEIVYDIKKAKAIELTALFETKKAKVLQQLREKRAAMAQREKDAEAARVAAEAELQAKREMEKIAARKAERMEAAKASKPDYSSVDVEDKKAFDELKKELKIYLEKFHGKKYDDLKKQFPNGGMLVEIHHEELMRLVKAIYQNSSKNNKKKWAKPFAKNADLKKVGEWIGNDKAQILLNN